jgi:hypothetical protein
MDILIEILLELYMELMFLIIPEDKRNKRYRRIAIIVAIVCTFGLMAMWIWGGYLIVERDNALGVIPIVIATILSAVQIGFGIYLRNKKKK